MLREMLRAKVHRATVTDRNVEYVGSLTLDASLMEACDLLPYERVDVYDVHNGARFSTYLMPGEPDSGVCCVNGAAARRVEVGDKIIIAAYAALTDEEARRHRPRVLLVDGKNRPLKEQPPIR
jgi:aspartate 1-decarboxylase